MSLQIFLHGKIPGIEDFLRNASGDFVERAQWVTLLSEVLPRALLAEFGLSKVLLGSSGGGQFLLVLPQEFRARAIEFCQRASDAIFARSGGSLTVAVATTENLGSWTDIRHRLLLELQERMGTPAASYGSTVFFEPVQSSAAVPFTSLYRSGSSDGWSPSQHAEIQNAEASHNWVLGEDIPFADHTAPDDDGSGP